eukprot:347547-Pleurochrysis_carterae.AAC.4
MSTCDMRFNVYVRHAPSEPSEFQGIQSFLRAAAHDASEPIPESLVTLLESLIILRKASGRAC